MRQSGRTTRILQEANEAKKRGERVLVVCPTTMHLDNMIMTARKMGFLLGGAPTGELDRRKDFAVVRQVIEGRYRGFKGSIYDDHTVKECLRPAEASKYYQEVDMMQMMIPTFVPPAPKPPKPPRWKFQPF